MKSSAEALERLKRPLDEKAFVNMTAGEAMPTPDQRVNPHVLITSSSE